MLACLLVAFFMLILFPSVALAAVVSMKDADFTSPEVQAKVILSLTEEQVDELTLIEDTVNALHAAMGGISADDSQAISKLESKLASLENAQKKMKTVNAYYRKHKTLDGDPHLSEDETLKLKSGMASSWRVEDKPYPSWALSNNNAEIRRVKERIASLTRQKEVGHTGWDFDGGRVEANRSDNRLQTFFDDKPDEKTRAALKSNGFRWAPSVGAWQRQLNDNAIYAADRLGCIRPLTDENPSELQRRVRLERQMEADELESIPDQNGSEEQEQDSGMQMC